MSTLMLKKVIYPRKDTLGQKESRVESNGYSHKYFRWRLKNRTKVSWGRSPVERERVQHVATPRRPRKYIKVEEANVRKTARKIPKRSASWITARPTSGLNLVLDRIETSNAEYKRFVQLEQQELQQKVITDFVELQTRMVRPPKDLANVKKKLQEADSGEKARKLKGVLEEAVDQDAASPHLLQRMNWERARTINLATESLNDVNLSLMTLGLSLKHFFRSLSKITATQHLRERGSRVCTLIKTTNTLYPAAYSLPFSAQKRSSCVRLLVHQRANHS